MPDEKLTEQVSALVDDELARREQPLLLRRLVNERDLRDRLERYVLIGEALRGNLPRALGRGFAEAISARIAGEPAPADTGRTRRLARGVAGLAVAASVAAVALVSMQPGQLQQDAEPEATTVVPVTATQQAPMPRFATSPGMSWERARPEVQVQLNRYLMTHSDAATVDPVSADEAGATEAER